MTPSLNQGRFLRRTIESVLGQTYPRIEYIVIDGGSTDETMSVLQFFSGRLKWISEPDRGQPHAINKGLSLCNGEILSYLNSDDILLPGALDRVVRYFREHPECDMVYGDADYIDENDRVTGAYPTADYTFENLKEECFICQPAAFWRRSAAERVGAFDERLQYAMDYDYWLRMAGAGCVIRHLPETLARCRLHPASKTESARVAIRRETIEVCWRNTGAAHAKYFVAYWHHLIRDGIRAPFRALRVIPYIEVFIGHLHHRGYHAVRALSRSFRRA